MTLKKPITLNPEESVVFKDNILRVLRKFGFKRDASAIRDYCVDSAAGTLHVSVLDQSLSCEFRECLESNRTMLDRSHSSFTGKWEFLGPDILFMFEHDMGRLIPSPVASRDLQPVW
jgi:hypothetical protein